MNSEMKQKWLEALRSGRYRQTRAKLKARNGACCCLGVLCHVAGVQWEYRADEWDEPRYFANDENDTYLPAGLSREIGLPRKQQEQLASLNDGDPVRDQHPQSFSDIANYIEKHL